MIELSVVLISKNQAWNISRLIESVIEGTSCIPDKEIVLVDSASTDDTVEIAQRYPVSIFRLHPNQRLSPAIGRYVGYQHTCGEFVLFLDGDMELLRSWVDCALRAMRASPGAGIAMSSGVIGLPKNAGQATHVAQLCEESFGQPKATWEVSFSAGGAALYRRSVLEHVGPFNPYLFSEEEPELCLRIRHAGYFVLLFDEPVVRHYDDARVSVSSVLRRRRRNFHLGMGQAARYHFGTKLFWTWLKERWWEPAAVLLFACGLGTLLASLISRDAAWFGSWVLAFILLIAAVTIRKRSVHSAIVAVFSWCVMAEGFLKGFLKKPTSPDSFTARAEPVMSFRQQSGGITVSETADMLLHEKL
ncbi:MAG TPA: glycosyltransferase [Candidatus Acidoferrum sp.]|nr:glycosyltransferase [Candidatus Acidoferrum sp.]